MAEALSASMTPMSSSVYLASITHTIICHRLEIGMILKRHREMHQRLLDSLQAENILTRRLYQ